MQRLEVSGAVRPIYGSLGVKGLREEHGLRLFQNWLRRKIFGPRRDEVTGAWRKLHNEEFHNLLHINIIRVMK